MHLAPAAIAIGVDSPLSSEVLGCACDADCSTGPDCVERIMTPTPHVMGRN